jgi:phosphoglycerate dehydrogenase-like enzyme
MKKNSRAAWLPYHAKEFRDLPEGIECLYWDGSHTFPGDPSEVGFLVPASAPGHERALGRVLPLARHLDVLQLLSSGYDYVLPHLESLPPGARVSTARGVHAEATAELAMALLLASSRGLDQYLRQQASARWQSADVRTLFGKRVLVLGQGAVGSAVSARLGPFGCDVVRVARTARDTPDGHVSGVADLRELLPTVDVVILCAPLTDETRGILDSPTLALLKDDALVVNVGRGELLHTDALVRELQRGRLRAALDVTAPEPLPADHPLWRLPGVLITPHTGAFTDAFPADSMRFLDRQLRRYALGEALENVVMTAGDLR